MSLSQNFGIIHHGLSPIAVDISGSLSNYKDNNERYNRTKNTLLGCCSWAITLVSFASFEESSSFGFGAYQTQMRMQF